MPRPSKKKSPVSDQTPVFKRIASVPLKLSNIRSWVLYSIRETYEKQNVRNKILKHILHNGITRRGYIPVYGKTINNRTSQSSLKSYIEELTTQYPPDPDSKLVIMFTVSNQYDPVTHETHFQSFIYVPGSAIIYAFDPARDCWQDEGIYAAHAVDEVEDLIKYYNDSKKTIDANLQITVAFPEVVEACQIHDNDVFCQTWSLFLQVFAIFTLLTTGKVEENPIIPVDQFEKYQILLNFYKKTVPIICDELRKNYSSLPNLPTAYKKGIDPCDILMNMVCNRDSDIIDCSLCGPPHDKTNIRCPEIVKQQFITRDNSFDNSRKKSRVRSRKRSGVLRTKRSRKRSTPLRSKRSRKKSHARPRKQSHKRSRKTSRKRSRKRSHKRSRKRSTPLRTKRSHKRSGVLRTKRSHKRSRKFHVHSEGKAPLKYKPAGMGRAAFKQRLAERKMNKLLEGFCEMQLSAAGASGAGAGGVDDICSGMVGLRMNGDGGAMQPSGGTSIGVDDIISGMDRLHMNKFSFDAEGVAHVRDTLDSQGNLDIGMCLDLLYRELTAHPSLSDNTKRLLTESIDDIIIKSSNPGDELSSQTIRMCELVNRLNQARLTSNAISSDSSGSRSTSDSGSSSSSGSSGSSDSGSNALGQPGGMISRSASSNSQDSGDSRDSQDSGAPEVFWQGDASGGVSWDDPVDDRNSQSSPSAESTQVNHLGWDL